MKERIILVNGHLVRQILDTDFGILHRHSSGLGSAYDRKPYIPKGQIWVDIRHRHEIPHLLRIDNRLAKDPRNYSQKRLELIEKLSPNRSRIIEFISKEERKGDLLIRYVLGDKIRLLIDPEFVQGGHDLVYPYIPPFHIWIDMLDNPLDFPHVELHETLERKLMHEGKSYDIAHDFAVAAEKESRRQAGAIYPGDANYHEQPARQVLRSLILARL